MINILEAGEALELFDRRANEMADLDIRENVAGIVAGVRDGGDEAICSLTARLDGCFIEPERIKVSAEEIEFARKSADREFMGALREARDNIRDYHERQKINSWFECERSGVFLGQLIRPLERVGIYVPGGKASYPSSVLMNAIPAVVAGVREIAMVTPPGKDGQININTLAAAAEAGITEIYRIGGAQAVAALAYGTQTVRRVDKITGPGNRYVTMAKRIVYGTVDIDMLAGPSEILVVADSSANPSYVAADLLSQAEHDEMAAAILITPDRALAASVRDEVERQLKLLHRSEIAARAVSDYGAIVIAGSVGEAIELANRISPEHLELAVSDPLSWLGQVRSTGAVFLGHFSPEPVGDYTAGPSHILPTGGTARFFSPLGVETFIKRTSVISYSREALEKEAGSIMKMALVEGLDAHAASVEIRMQKNILKSVEKVFDKGDEVSNGRFDIIQDIATESSAGDNSDLWELQELSGLPGFPDHKSGES